MSKSEQKKIEIMTENQEQAIPLQQEVHTALMQTAIPILGHVESTLNTTKIPGIKMYWEGTGLSITVKNRNYFVPSPNIKLLIMK